MKIAKRRFRGVAVFYLLKAYRMLRKGDVMKIYIGITDNNGYSYLANIQPDEVKFCQPGYSALVLTSELTRRYSHESFKNSIIEFDIFKAGFSGNPVHRERSFQ